MLAMATRIMASLVQLIFMAESSTCTKGGTVSALRAVQNRLEVDISTQAYLGEDGFQRKPDHVLSKRLCEVTLAVQCSQSKQELQRPQKCRDWRAVQKTKAQHVPDTQLFQLQHQRG